MITVTYDPINGEAIPDGKIAEIIAQMLCFPEQNQEVTVSTSLFIDEIRACIAEQKISHEKVTFRYEDHIITPNQKGKLPYWPKGFCDGFDNRLDRLLGIDYW